MLPTLLLVTMIHAPVLPTKAVTRPPKPPTPTATPVATKTPKPATAAPAATNTPVRPTATPAVTSTSAPALASISASPSSLDFGNQPLRTTSAPRAVTLVNTGALPLTISSIGVASDGDFAEADTCSSGPIAPGGGCTASITFTPLVPGSSSASLIINDNAAASPQTVPLTGNGIGTTVSVSPGSVDFGSQLVGITSTARTVTIINTGSLPLNVNSIRVRRQSGFTETDTCYTGPIASGGSCTIGLTFTPLALGASSSPLIINDDAVGAPQMIPLSGNGVSSLPPPIAPTAAPTGRISLTPTPTRAPGPRAGTRPPAVRRSRPALPLSLSVAPRLVVSGRVLTIHIRTSPYARVHLAFRVVTKKAVSRGHGKRRQQVWTTKVWYRLVRQGSANRRGQFNARLRVTYHPIKGASAWLTVTVHTAKGTASRTMKVTIQPRRQPAPAGRHRAPTSGRGRGHGDICRRCLLRPPARPPLSNAWLLPQSP